MVNEILALRVAGDMRPGVYAAEVCQVCGSLATFDGFMAAWAAHPGKERAFVCESCRMSQPPKKVDDQSSRYCEICAFQMLPDRRLLCGHHWVCDLCRNAWSAEFPSGSLDKFLNDFVRRRYLAIRHPTASSVVSLYQRLVGMSSAVVALNTREDA